MRFGRVLVLAAPAAFLLIGLVPVSTTIEVDRTTARADGRSTIRAKAERRSLFGLPALGDPEPLSVEPTLDVTVLPAHDGSTVIRAGQQAGTLTLTAGEAEKTVELVLDPTDADRDGFPDVAELLTEEDRAAFRAWFTTTAEAQAHRIDDRWAKVHQDCAGLVRFAYKEALRKHERPGHRDVAAFTYPNIPLLGDEPFQMRDGFTAAANAKTLWEHNTRMISKDVSAGLPGDLLFFKTEEGMHSMVLLAGGRVVYHTGSKDGVRLVSLAMLSAHPDAAWHPVPHNPKFLGVHRFHILMHETRAPLALGGL